MRAGGASSSRQVGTEVDLTLKHKFDRHALVSVGYSHFFAGDVIDESGPSDDIDFVYVSHQFTF